MFSVVREVHNFDFRLVTNNIYMCVYIYIYIYIYILKLIVKKGKVHPCADTEALCRPYGPLGE